MATYNLADLGCDPSDVLVAIVNINNNFLHVDLDGLLSIICANGLAFYQSGFVDVVDVHHSQGPVPNYVTFWPIANSAFLSLNKDEDGNWTGNSAAACIQRHALKNSVKIRGRYLPDLVPGNIAPMRVLLIEKA
jgi:hypothetical protein